MKEMSKAKYTFFLFRIIAKKSINSIMNEKLLLDELSNPFIINSRSYFQDRDNLYLVMEYLRGGDLRYHMCYYECFDEQQASMLFILYRIYC
jgi:serum/glucocorticoid-regulated kinase 2